MTWTRCSRRWPIRRAGGCSTGCTSGTARRWASCAARSTWPASRRPSTSAVLEAANLVSTVWRGREKLHYLNPVPLHEIQERWIDKFETPAAARAERRPSDAAEEQP